MLAIWPGQEGCAATHLRHLGALNGEAFGVYMYFQRAERKKIRLKVPQILNIMTYKSTAFF